MEQIKQEIREITPVIAKSILDKNKINRPIRKRVVAFYANQMKLGRWELVPDPIVISEKHNLMNGQHRLRAVILSNTVHSFYVTINHPESSYKNMDCGLKRNGSDVLFHEGAKYHSALSSSIKKYITLVKESKAYVFSSGIDVAMTKIDNAMILDQYLENREDWDNVIKESVKIYSKGYKILKSSEIAAIWMYLLSFKGYHISVIKPFFEQLKDIPGAYRDVAIIKSTRKILVNDLINKREMSKISPKNKYKIIAYTWNNYIKKTGVKMVRFNNIPDDIQFI